MSENQQEQSEAKLLAYIEGDLDAAARAEIERHLEANPHHRRMLDELGATRDLVRLLPRESAPPELLETFQGHLERAELLAPAAVADEARPSSSAFRINRWPQFRAAAAMLLVATGVAATIYFGYLKNRPGNTPIAKTSPGDPVSPQTNPTEPHAVEGKDKVEVAKRGPDGKVPADERGDRFTGKHEGPGPGEIAAKPAGPAAGTPADAVAGAGGAGQAPVAAAPEIDAGQLARLEEALMAIAVRNAWDMPQVRDAVVSNSPAYGGNASSGGGDATRGAGNKDSSLAAPGGGSGAAPSAPRPPTRGGGEEPATRPAAAAAAVAALPPAGQPGGAPRPEGDRALVVSNYNPSPLFVVVAAPDMESAERQVKEYLTVNGIQAETVDRGTVRELERRANRDPGLSNLEIADAAVPAPESTPAPPAAPETRQYPEPPAVAGGGAGGRPDANPKGAVAGAYTAAGEERYKDAASSGRASKSEAGGGAGGVGGGGAAAGAAAPPPPAPAPRTAADAIDIVRNQTSGKAGAAPEPVAPAAADPGVDQPQQHQQGFRQYPGPSGGAGAEQQQAEVSQLAARQARNGAYQNNGGAQIGGVVIARRMSMRKTLDLQNTVHRPAASQRAQVFEQTAAQGRRGGGGYNVQVQKQQFDAQLQTAVATAPPPPLPATPDAAASDATPIEKEMAARRMAAAAKADAGAADRARSRSPATTQPATFAARDGQAREGKATDSEARPSAPAPTVAQPPAAPPAATPGPVAGGTRAATGTAGMTRGAGGPGAAPPAPAAQPPPAAVPARPAEPAPAQVAQQPGVAAEVARTAPATAPASAVPATAPAAAQADVATAEEEQRDVVIVLLKPQFVGAEQANQAPAGPATAPAQPNAAGQIQQQPQLPQSGQQIQPQSSQPSPPPPAGDAAKEAK